MLTASLNNINIPLDAGFSFRMTWANPACYMDELPGKSGIGIEIPVNEYSRMAFGNPERFEKYSLISDRKFPGFEIRSGGALLISGTINVISASSGSYSTWIQDELGVWGEEQRDKLISDMLWDPEGERTFANKTEYDDDTDDYFPFSIRNGAFWNGKGRETTVKREYIDEDGEVHKVNDTITFLTEKFRNNFLRIVNRLSLSGDIDILGQDNDGEACVVSPYLYLRRFLDMLFKINHFYIDRNDLNKSGVYLEKCLLLYNNFNIIGQNFVIEEQTVSTWMSEENEWVETVENVITGMSWAPETFRYADLVPHVSIKDLLVGLQNYLNYVFFFKTQDKVDIIDRNTLTAGDAFDLDDYFLGEWVKGEQKDVTLKFINEFDGEDRMFGQEYHDLTDRRADFGDPVETHSDLFYLLDPPEGQLRLVKDENKIYEYRWKVLTSEDVLKRETQLDAMGWEFISSGPQPYLYGTGDKIEEIKSCFSTLQNVNDPFFYFPVPVALQQGNLKKMKGNFIGFTPRLINSFELVFPQALNWDGDNGLFKTRWEKWARFWKNRMPVEGYFDLPLNVIYYISNHITQKFRTRHGEFFIETMETEFGINSIGATRITGYKI